MDRARAAFHSLPLNRKHPRYDEALKLADAACHPDTDGKNGAKANDLDWEQLFRLERLTLQLATHEGLVAQAETVRSQYDRLPQSPREQNHPCLSVSVCKLLDETAKLRAELTFKLDAVQWDLRKSVELELALEKMRKQVGIGGAVLALVFLALLCLDETNSCVLDCTFPRFACWLCTVPQPIWWAMLFGTLGAVTSLFRRMSDPLDVDLDMRRYTPYKNVAMILGGNSDIWFSLAAGPMFALVLVQLFAAGLLKGDLFPEVCATFKDGMPHLIIGKAADYAKLAIWAFIGGFAETFVPDVVNRLAGRGRDSAGLNNSQKKPSS